HRHELMVVGRFLGDVGSDDDLILGDDGLGVVALEVSGRVMHDRTVRVSDVGPRLRASSPRCKRSTATPGSARLLRGGFGRYPRGIFGVAAGVVGVQARLGRGDASPATG